MKKHQFIALLFGLALLAVFGAAWQLFLRAPSADVRPVTVQVEQGDGVKRVSGRLKETGLISNRFLFEAYARAAGAEAAFQPGAFALLPGTSYASLVDALTRPRVSELTVTVPEGYTLAQIGAVFEEAGLFSQDAWLAIVGDPAVDYRAETEARRPTEFSAEFSFLASKPAYVSLEGYLFPDTYRFLKGATPEEAVVKMLANFDRKLTPEMRAAIKASGRSVHEVVTLASIVEREVRTARDRPLIADLFWRRLGIGMALQADSTVNYLTGKKTPAVSNDDRAVNSSWNTYMYSGLPPGPISNPGAAALEGTVFPETNDAWYFLTNETGTVYYAETNDAHNRNKDLYLP
ncbi:endolytic transglycosylase MltG [Candidatus Uhrbacteria bacterium]|nr:endolytic transglycosylase MltG [Candidatus Uhrbacteria bacterium]MBI4598576.1 endolytic transglycosylase MltG [Candidatus Uhrbacteria bacterium]